MAARSPGVGDMSSCASSSRSSRRSPTRVPARESTEGGSDVSYTCRSGLDAPQGPAQLASQSHESAEVHRMHRLSLFWQHYMQMAAVMVVGMIATGAIFLSIVGLKTWDEVTIQ
jgi:hypothetical protein